MNKKVIVALIMLMGIRVNMHLVMGEQSSYSRGVGVEIAQDFVPIAPEPDEGIIEVEREEGQSNNESNNQGVLINRLPWTGNEFRVMLLLLLVILGSVVYKINDKQKTKYKGVSNNVKL